MKNLILATALAAVAVSSVAPASAQVVRRDYYGNTQGVTEPSANQTRGYDSGFSGYDSSYNTGFGLPPLVCLLFCGSRKPKDGELRTLADGTTVSYSKAIRNWVVVHSPATQPRGVYTDRDTYYAR